MKVALEVGAVALVFGVMLCSLMAITTWLYAAERHRLWHLLFAAWSMDLLAWALVYLVRVAGTS